jgi:hypothetical protein
VPTRAARPVHVAQLEERRGLGATSVTSLTFATTVGSAEPMQQTVGISNGGGGSLTGLTATVSYPAMSGWLMASLSSQTAPSTLTIQVTKPLAAGTYVAVVSLASPVAANSPRTNRLRRG